MCRSSSILLLLAIGIASAAHAADAPPRLHGGGHPVSVAELPPGRFRAQLAGLPPAAQTQALAWLSRMQFHDADCADLNADLGGGVFFACTNSVPAVAGAAPSARTPVVAAASVPIASPPSYHSKLGATRRIYLDFNGMTITGTAWNPSSGAGTTYLAKPYDVDGDATTFNDAEQAAIQRVWQRVAEDYAPFDVDVTTDPAVEGTIDQNTGHVLITANTDANGTAMPSSSAGGVAYVGVFGASSYVATYSPALVYFNNLAGGREDIVAEACAHEMGHNLGLSHDDVIGGTGYYGGHGSGATSWGPIMGVGYGRNVSQFSKGEYFNANNTQDDLAIISGYLPYRADDHGGTDATASPLTGTTLSASGIIERNTDVDVVSFVTGAGSISLTVSPWQSPADTAGGDLDVGLILVNGSGAIVATADDASTVAAGITATVPAGTYFLHIYGVGVGSPQTNPPSGYTSYASLGQWFLSGTVIAPLVDTLPPSASATLPDVTSAGGTTQQFTVTYSDDIAIAVSTIDNADVRVTGPNGYSATATFISLDVAGDGTPRTATYRIPAPGGSWDYLDNGIYTVSALASAVSDTSSRTLAAGSLGTFQVGCPVPPGPGAGILREWFDGIAGTSVASLTSAPAYPGSPTGSVITGIFEAPTNRADNYGQRMRGWFIAPMAGAYTFVIASDDTSELWLSSDATPAHASRIAYVSTSTAVREWTKEANQTSAPVTLAAGLRYYIEARHKEGAGGDNLAVGVVLPGGVAEEPIPGHRLDPFFFITASAPAPSADETGTIGIFTIARSAALTAAATTIAYSVSGTATPGADYAALSGSAIIPAGAASVDVTVTAVADAVSEGSETVILTLAAGSGYTLGAPASATVTISDAPLRAGAVAAGQPSGSAKCGAGAFAALLALNLMMLRRRRVP